MRCSFAVPCLAFVLLEAALSCAAYGQEDWSAAEEAKADGVLRESLNPQELQQVLLELARRDHPRALEQLRSALTNSQFLQRCGQANFRGYWQTLYEQQRWVKSVLLAAAERRGLELESFLKSLGENEAFMCEQYRPQFLGLALRRHRGKDTDVDIKGWERTLRESRDPDELHRTLMQLASSDHPGALAALSAALCDHDVVAHCKLDVYNCRLDDVLLTVAEGPAPVAEALFIALAASKAFTDAEGAAGTLTIACGAVRGASDRMVDLIWRLTEIRTPGMVSILARMHATAASNRIIKYFEAGGCFDYSLIHCLMPERAHPAVLAIYRHFISRGGTLKPSVREILVMTLFDYQRNWYLPDAWAGDPLPWTDASPEALRMVLEMAPIALALDIPDALKEKVKKTKLEIEGIVEKRRKADADVKVEGPLK